MAFAEQGSIMAAHQAVSAGIKITGSRYDGAGCGLKDHFINRRERRDRGELRRETPEIAGIFSAASAGSAVKRVFLK